ncbi:MAG: Asp-tRNA(Asn)/Glu-tRNA(Gln) amidotransferase subunit GatC [Nitrospirae bacterium]|nr:MAG: Asp-tRNA(Asn)/Glu-tRNA(Gln) amidotransferase subunit GatC [Nitrospirota bacterium]
MAITQAEVEHMARLARLDLSEQEKALFCEQLSHILSYMDQLRQVPTDGVPHTSTVIEQSNAFRDDIPTPSLPVQAVIANAPEAVDGFFVVPKILENP